MGIKPLETSQSEQSIWQACSGHFNILLNLQLRWLQHIILPAMFLCYMSLHFIIWVYLVMC